MTQETIESLATLFRAAAYGPFFLDVRTALLALLSVVPRCSCLYAQVCRRARSTAVYGSLGLLHFCYTKTSLVFADKTHTVELCANDTVQDVKAVVEARQGMHRD